MAFMIYTLDKSGHEHVRDEHRAAHYDHLQAHQSRLIASGGLRDEGDVNIIGGAIFFDTDSREEVDRFVAEDPFTKAGLFETTHITRWRAAFIEGRSVR